MHNIVVQKFFILFSALESFGDPARETVTYVPFAMNEWRFSLVSWLAWSIQKKEHTQQPQTTLSRAGGDFLVANARDYIA